MKRKDVGKPQGGIFQRVKKFLVGTPPPSSQEGYNHSATVTNWSSKFDDTPLDGDRVVNGIHCKTAGEYSAACAKFYGPECSE